MCSRAAPGGALCSRCAPGGERERQTGRLSALSALSEDTVPWAWEQVRGTASGRARAAACAPHKRSEAPPCRACARACPLPLPRSSPRSSWVPWRGSPPAGSRARSRMNAAAATSGRRVPWCGSHGCLGAAVRRPGLARARGWTPPPPPRAWGDTQRGTTHTERRDAASSVGRHTARHDAHREARRRLECGETHSEARNTPRQRDTAPRVSLRRRLECGETHAETARHDAHREARRKSDTRRGGDTRERHTPKRHTRATHAEATRRTQESEPRPHTIHAAAHPALRRRALAAAGS
jgi:hypothetical protein